MVNHFVWGLKCILHWFENFGVVAKGAGLC